MDFIKELVVALLIVSGGFFALVGSLGLAKLSDTMTRLHGPTKATTLGVGSILVASMLYFLLFEGQVSIHEVLITLFLFLTAPVTANMVAKAYLHDEQAGPEALPPPDGPATEPDVGWATFDPKAERHDFR